MSHRVGAAAGDHAPPLGWGPVIAVGSVEQGDRARLDSRDSLGGAVAVWLATEVNPKGLILESTFSSVVDMAEHHYPFLPVRYISRFKYDSLSLAPKIEIPTLVLHSREDNIVPFDLGLKLYEALPGDKSFIEMRGGHNDGFFVSGEHYVNGIKDFIESL